jgi:hypothetical protein
MAVRVLEKSEQMFMANTSQFVFHCELATDPGLTTTFGAEIQVASANVEPHVATFGGQEEYDARMVAHLLRLDRKRPEATFNNFNEMMDWLDRE